MTRSVLKYLCCTRCPREAVSSKNNSRSVNIISLDSNQKSDIPLTKLNCRSCGIINIPKEKWCISCCSCTRCCAGCIEYIAEESGLSLAPALDNKSKDSELDRLDGLSP